MQASLETITFNEPAPAIEQLVLNFDAEFLLIVEKIEESISPEVKESINTEIINKPAGYQDQGYRQD